MNRLTSIDPAGKMLWFDLDDTLWDMTGNSAVCLREIYDMEHLDRFFDSPEQWDTIYHHINAELWNRYSLGLISQDYLRTERFAEPLRQVGVGEGEALRLSEKLDPLYLGLLGSKSTLVAGARQALERLAAVGWRMGIVSNGFIEVQYRKLASAGISDFFDIVVLSDEIGINKPDSRFFDYAASRASCAIHNYNH